MAFACSRWLKVEGRGALLVWGRPGRLMTLIVIRARREQRFVRESCLPLLQEPKQHAL